jgi:integrase
MSSRGNLHRKCIKGHTKQQGKCSGRCLRWYARIELPRGPDGKRRFAYLGGHPTREQAEAAVVEELQRRGQGIALEAHKLTVNQYLDRWLAHIQTTLRARTVARYRSLLAHHVRPYIGTRLLKPLQPLEVQAVYDQLAVGGRKDGKPGGLDAQHILAVHRCLHRALEQAVTWRLIPRNVAKDATPPPVPHKDTPALLPEQVDLLLDAATADPKTWVRAWTVLAAATGARNGELCGLEWSDLNLDEGTIRFRQELTVVDVDVLPGGTNAGSDGRRKELAVGPVKSKASKAILSLPPFAVEALRDYRRRQACLRLAGAQAAVVTLRWVEPGQPPRPIDLDLVFRTERGTALNPNHASRGFANLARKAGLQAHPHMLRHALASAMAANREPASIIAAQLRHADGGALAQRVYIHQLPQTAPRVAGLIEGLFGPAASAERRAGTERSPRRGGVA